jgi:hypothetical protein
MQVTKAAAAAAARLAKKKPNSHMGFLRQKQDGSTSLGEKNNQRFEETYPETSAESFDDMQFVSDV